MKLTGKKKKKHENFPKNQNSNRKRKGKERSGNRAHKAHVSEYQLLAVEEKIKGKILGSHAAALQRSKIIQISFLIRRCFNAILAV